MIKKLYSILFLVFIIEAKAQEINSNTPSLTCSDSIKKHSLQWANIGVGFSFPTTSNSIKGPEIGLNYNWLIKKVTLQFNASHTQKLSLSSSPLVLNVVGIGIGRNIVKGFYNVGIIIGPGIMWGQENLGYDYEKKYVNAGVSLSAQLIGKPIKNFGLGFELFAHMNKDFNSTGAKFILHFNTQK